MLMDVDESQLVLIDYQDKFLPALWEGQACWDNAMKLAQAAHLLSVPVWGTEQNPSRLGSLPPAMKALCRQTLSKMHFSACKEGLLELLQPTPSARPVQGNARSLPKHLQKPISIEPERDFLRGHHRRGLLCHFVGDFHDCLYGCVAFRCGVGDVFDAATRVES
jgi:hypothetical protein